jgi:hypothetical protein
MRYKLRTLLIVLALGPMVLARGYWEWRAYDEMRWRWQVVESNLGTWTPHTTIMYLPPVKPGYRFRQGRDGSVSEVPTDAD